MLGPLNTSYLGAGRIGHSEDSSGWWRVAEAEMLARGVCLYGVHPQPG
jgi:hypothetical protein